jgi:hypothetical protein
MKFGWETLKQVTHGSKSTSSKSPFLHQCPSCTYAYYQET